MRILCVGEMMVDLLVHPVPEVKFDNDASFVKAIDVKSGGDANNNAIDLAKLGNEVYYVGLAGNDAMADNCLRIAESFGVSTDYVKRSDTTAQTKSLILINENGDRHFLQYAGTSAEFCYEDIDLSVLDKVDFLQIGGTFHLPKFDGEGAMKLLKMAKKKGITTCMDVTKDRTNTWDPIIHCCYPYLDYFLPSIEQAEQIVGTSDEQKIADYFLSEGVGTVGIKLGSKGCFFKSSDQAFYLGRYTVPVAETTGAGDAFVAGFLSRLGRGGTLRECAEFATATSAHAVQAFGATTGVPDYHTIDMFIKNQPQLEYTPLL